MSDPLLCWSGKHLFKNGDGRQALELVDSKTFSTGIVSLAYRLEGR